MTIEEAYDVLVKCVKEIHKRVVINMANFKVKVITKSGIHDLENITTEKLALLKTN